MPYFLKGRIPFFIDYVLHSGYEFEAVLKSFGMDHRVWIVGVPEKGVEIHFRAVLCGDIPVFYLKTNAAILTVGDKTSQRLAFGLSFDSALSNEGIRDHGLEASQTSVMGFSTHKEFTSVLYPAGTEAWIAMIERSVWVEAAVSLGFPECADMADMSNMLTLDVPAWESFQFYMRRTIVCPISDDTGAEAERLLLSLMTLMSRSKGHLSEAMGIGSRGQCLANALIDDMKAMECLAYPMPLKQICSRHFCSEETVRKTVLRMANTTPAKFAKLIREQQILHLINTPGLIETSYGKGSLGQAFCAHQFGYTSFGVMKRRLGKKYRLAFAQKSLVSS